MEVLDGQGTKREYSRIKGQRLQTYQNDYSKNRRAEKDYSTYFMGNIRYGNYENCDRSNCSCAFWKT
nr:MAG TPA: hypothetical protein [Bacteriophage sp.]